MNQAFSGYVFKKRIDLTEVCIKEDGTKDERFVTLREPTDDEFFKIVAGAQGDGVSEEVGMMQAFGPLLPELIFEHNFWDGDKKISNKEVAEFIRSKTEALTTVTLEYITSIPLLTKAGKK
jgi:hypothetical protein